MARIIILFLSLITIAHAATQDIYPFKSEADAKRFAALTNEIRCVVCQNQTIADSNAPLAKDLRGKIYTLMAENKSDADIKNYLAERYSEFILLKPRLNKLTVVLWIFPLLALLFIFIILVFFVRKQKTIPSTVKHS